MTFDGNISIFLYFADAKAGVYRRLSINPGETLQNYTIYLSVGTIQYDGSGTFDQSITFHELPACLQMIYSSKEARTDT